ncbi:MULTISPECIES: DUF6503 family protein [Flavobacteriaceae]|uniref:DUF6503 family protein n=1 Tax=Flavobacteriaceae TaxID=49546 RepID=UPI0014914187|nr:MULTISPECIES: DUF6503 family protein [Allomuricauda]MDC6366299.1 DUF6503 family protein [Muricauda sp. AC10]
MRYSILILAFCHCLVSQAQELTASELLDNSIHFHDPNNHWKSFKGEFKVLMQTPNSSERLSTITLNIPKQLFKLMVEKDGVAYGYDFNANKCTSTLQGSSEISDDDREKYRLTCERGKMMRNYYTYLYGLPMKLKDPGTLLNPTIHKKTFKGKEYLVLKVDYEEGVGNDVWYFYFDPITYAMEVYQFYHDESKNDGEYILLEGLEEINGIKIPKNRAWYYNSDDKYLGTDILEKPTM